MKIFALVIAAAHTPEYIIDCVNSVLMQEITGNWKYDIRIGVDGCKRTSEILIRNKVKHWFSYNNVGAYIMRNSLMLLKAADAYGYFDADDIMKPDYIKTTIKAIQSGHKAVMLAKTEVNENLQSLNKPHHIQDGGAISFTHEIFEKLGGFQPFRCAGDTDFMRRIVMAGYKIYKTDNRAYYLRRKHGKSLTRSGQTKFGGQYRKDAWHYMCNLRDEGLIYVKPVITELEER